MTIELRLGPPAEIFAIRSLLAAMCVVLGACASGPQPVTDPERRAQARFQGDRSRCKEVAERTFPYADPRDSRAVGERSVRVEADVQRCMLSRGWNDPRHDGWKAGRS